MNNTMNMRIIEIKRNQNFMVTKKKNNIYAIMISQMI